VHVSVSEHVPKLDFPHALARAAIPAAAPTAPSIQAHRTRMQASSRSVVPQKSPASPTPHPVGPSVGTTDAAAGACACLGHIHHVATAPATSAAPVT
jgi:hypothetical protein